MTIYSNPHLYDIAYNWRDVRAECAFMVNAYTTLTGRAPATALEIACGPGQHTRTLPAFNVACAGLDNSPDMLAYARTQPGGDLPDVTWLQGDMRTFTLPIPVDLAFCLMDSLSHLLTADDLLNHLATVAHSVTPGGLYILDQSHPRDAFGHPQPGMAPEWASASDDGDLTVETVWGAEDDPFDATTQIGLLSVTLSAYRGSELVAELHEQLPSRLWLATELEALIRLSGQWELTHRYGAMDAAIPWQNEPPAERMVSMLRRK